MPVTHLLIENMGAIAKIMKKSKIFHLPWTSRWVGIN
jgi:hypothetical protein